MCTVLGITFFLTSLLEYTVITFKKEFTQKRLSKTVKCANILVQKERKEEIGVIGKVIVQMEMKAVGGIGA